MATIKIPALPQTTQFDSTDEMVVEKLSGGTKRITKADMALAEEDMSNVDVNDVADLGIAKDDLSNVSSATTSTAGKIILATEDEVITGTDTEKATTSAGVKALFDTVSSSLPTGYINSIIMSNDTDTDHDINVTSGKARNTGNTTDMTLANEITKQIDATWAVGDDAGGLSSGVSLAVNTWYHVHLISNNVGVPVAGNFATVDIDTNLSNFQAVSDGYITVTVDGGSAQDISSLDFTSATTMDNIATIIDAQVTGATVTNLSGVLTFESVTTGSSSSVAVTQTGAGVGTDLSTFSYLNIASGTQTNGNDGTDVGFDTSVTAVNLLADSAVITAGYTKYRRIGSILTDASSNIIQFIQTGDRIYWASRINDFGTTTPANTKTNITVSTPADISTVGLFNLQARDSSSSYINAFGFGEADRAPIADDSDFYCVGVDQDATYFERIANDSTIAYRSSNTAMDSLRIFTRGYLDLRGKE